MHATLHRPLMAALLAGAILALVFALTPSSPANAQTPVTARHDTISVHCDVDLDGDGRATVFFSNCGRFNGTNVVPGGLALTGGPQFIGYTPVRNVTRGVPGPVFAQIGQGTSESFRIRVFTGGGSTNGGSLRALPNDVVRLMIHASAVPFDDDQDPEPVPSPSPSPSPTAAP